MLEFGQPLHAFDLRFVEQGQIVVRYAGAGEKFITLDGKEHALQPRDVVIADPAKGIALAGIMGGQNSEIRDDTQDVLIECAYFDPVHVRRTRVPPLVSARSPAAVSSAVWTPTAFPASSTPPPR